MVIPRGCEVACNEPVVDKLCANLSTFRCLSCKLLQFLWCVWGCSKMATSTILLILGNRWMASWPIEETHVYTPYLYLRVDAWSASRDDCWLQPILSLFPLGKTMMQGSKQFLGCDCSAVSFCWSSRHNTPTPFQQRKLF